MEPNSDRVILVHGVASHRMVMWPLAFRLRCAGFQTEAWSYNSLVRSIESHAQDLSAYLNRPGMTDAKVHFVAHSMGSIVVLSALNRLEHTGVGRIVLLGPPIKGSPVAKIVSTLTNGLIAPARELSNRMGSYVTRLSVPKNREIGILAARYDFLVPSTNTHLETASCHRVLAATHNSLLVSKRVAHLTATFLKLGTFESD